MTSTNSTTPMPAYSNTQASPASPTSPQSAPPPAGRVARLFSPADLATMSDSQLKESLGALTHDERLVSAERNSLHERIGEVRGELERRGSDAEAPPPG